MTNYKHDELVNIVSAMMCLRFTEDMRAIQEHYINILNTMGECLSNLRISMDAKELESVLTKCIANAINNSMIKNPIGYEENVQTEEAKIQD